MPGEKHIQGNARHLPWAADDTPADQEFTAPSPQCRLGSATNFGGLAKANCFAAIVGN